MKCPYCGVDAINDNRKCTNCGYDIILKTRDPVRENIARIREYGLFGPVIADMMEARAQQEQKNPAELKYPDKDESRYTSNVEAETRARTDELYRWEERAVEAAKETGKQYQIPLKQTLHLDIPGMESFMTAGLAMMCMPIVVKAPEMMLKKKLEEKE